MTKEQQKALETANRRKFVNNIAAVAMMDILDQAENIRKTLDVKMRYQNYNRYIHLHKYCFDVSLLFYKDGNCHRRRILSGNRRCILSQESRIDGVFCRGADAAVSVTMEKMSQNQAVPVFSEEQEFRICA